MFTGWRRGIASVGVALALIAEGAPAVSAESPPGASESANEHIVGDRFEGLIMAPHGAQQWKPSREQIEVLEKALVAYLTPTIAVDGHAQSLSAEKLATYKRLYVGVEARRGRAIQIYLSCDLPQWPARVAWPRGGGACHIQATWSLTAAKIVSATANSSS
jgi:hypothetical protein